ncbi:MAG TPA: protein phosphatase 2C domain-containing protein [Aggregatilineales bacterium]|nr:protein phosphatase 2C domain-containing protein [Anaerolineales bacterium]HRE47571.1 protein phosphatase 2C domain-containing protein [Aggregatilineales bacterium]
MTTTADIRLRARAGQVTGRDHILRGMNCQDAYTLLEQADAVIGIVCDGCGVGGRSEVGAALAAQFISGRVARALAEGIALEGLPDVIYAETIRFLEGIVSAVDPMNRPGFVRDYLLFTVIGVVITPTGGVIFAAGDGLIVLDSRMIRRDENNTPSYIGYHVVDPAVLAEAALPSGFDIYPLPSDWARVAIATDGFEADVLPNLWGKAHPRGVQRWLNVLSSQEKRFRDDATVIAVERIGA